MVSSMPGVTLDELKGLPVGLEAEGKEARFRWV